MRFDVVKKVATLFFIVFSSLLSANNIDFAGEWRVDVEKTLKSNSEISEEQRKSLKNYLNQISLEFSKTGNYKETISPGNTIRGTWSKYKEDLVVVRCENDENIKKAKESLIEKIKNTIEDKRKNIRLRQTLYQLNRFSVKSFSLNTNSIHCQHKIGGNDVTLYFLKLN